MTKRDYYEILGISKTASDEDIKKGYRNEAKKWHPDANKDNPEAEMKFKEISEAYSVLSDPNKRIAYDRHGHSAFDGAGNTQNHHGFYTQNPFYTTNGFGFDINDILKGFGMKNTGPSRGFDVQTSINITFEESIFGGKKQIQFEVGESCNICNGTGATPNTEVKTCTKCNGTGEERLQQQTLLGITTTIKTCSSCQGKGKIIATPCNRCKGIGRIKTLKTFEITIPKGIDNNQIIRIREEGEFGERGGPRGDLLVKINIIPHEFFKRKGINLYLDVPMTFVQATLGDSFDVPTLDGSTEVIIPPGTQSDTKITLAGKGVPDIKNENHTGDLIIVLKLEIPTNLTDEQQRLLREFEKEMLNTDS